MEIKHITLGGMVALLAGSAAVIGNYEKVTNFFDPMVESEAEAKTDHAVLRAETRELLIAENDTKQTQAGYNAYMMRQILMQEIETLKLKIKTEKDPDKKAELQAELESKQEFARKLKQEERRQMMQGTDNG